jgi:hypothetical protein
MSQELNKRNSFIKAFKLSKALKQDLYFCNKRQQYFRLGHFLPTKGCCEKIMTFDKNNHIKDMLISHIMK